MNARRGDIAVLETGRSYGGPDGRTGFAVTVVASITRSGVVKAVKDLRWGDGVHAQPLGRICGLQRLHLIPQADIDVNGAVATARAHTWPGHTQPMDYASLEEVREALRPHMTKDDDA